jgi:imidazolonepropionase-like amidohydrolase
MRDFRLSLLVLAACVAAAIAVAGQAPARVTVYQGARLITGTGGAAIDNATFVVDGARFTQVGRGDAVKVPAGAARVDLAGKTVMPAIVDAHDRQTGSPGDDALSHLPLAYRALAQARDRIEVD